VRLRPLHHQEIQRIVERQLGHITRRQLLDLGFTAAWIDHRVAAGELVPVHAGVYAVGHVPRHAHARSLAAVLACGSGAALSHAAAAALWDVMDWPPTLEVTAPKERCRKGITTHRSSTLTPKDIRKRHGVPVTSPARTVLDLQPRLTDARLQRVVNDLRIAGHLSKTAFQELCALSTRVDQLLGDSDGRTQRATRSALEDLFRRFVTRHHLPMPEINAILDRKSGREVDALYRAERLIIEVDSWLFHRDRAAFERDRAKDAKALADGYRTVRITERRMKRGGAEEADQIRRILAQYSPSRRA
jgi:very-short-patch-repair endonuclease